MRRLRVQAIGCVDPAHLERLVDDRAGRRGNVEDPQVEVGVDGFERRERERSLGNHRRLAGGEQRLDVGFAESHLILREVRLQLTDNVQRGHIGRIGELRLPGQQLLLEIRSAVTGRGEGVLVERKQPRVLARGGERRHLGRQLLLRSRDHLLPRGRRLQLVLREDVLVVVDLERRHLQRDAVDLAVLLAPRAIQCLGLEIGQSRDQPVERSQITGLDQGLHTAVRPELSHIGAAGLSQTGGKDGVVFR
jgi:hypothetical protein